MDCFGKKTQKTDEDIMNILKSSCRYHLWLWKRFTHKTKCVWRDLSIKKIDRTSRVKLTKQA